MQDDSSYHERRAATQRRMAEGSADPAVAGAHQSLAELHDARARTANGGRPLLRIASPA